MVYPYKWSPISCQSGTDQGKSETDILPLSYAANQCSLCSYRPQYRIADLQIQNDLQITVSIIHIPTHTHIRPSRWTWISWFRHTSSLTPTHHVSLSEARGVKGRKYVIQRLQRLHGQMPFRSPTTTSYPVDLIIPSITNRLLSSLLCML